VPSGRAATACVDTLGAPALTPASGTSTPSSSSRAAAAAARSGAMPLRSRSHAPMCFCSTVPAVFQSDDEEALVDWSSRAPLRLCRAAPFDRAITSTALIFFRRFYLRAKLAEYPPHEMM
jgi:hypothetical protein